MVDWKLWLLVALAFLVGYFVGFTQNISVTIDTVDERWIDAVDDPFGIGMETPISALDASPTNVPETVFRVDTVPRPHDVFSDVSVRVKPSGGVCTVFGEADDSLKRAARLNFLYVRAELVRKYGEEQRYPTRNPNDPHMESVWHRSEGANLPKNIDRIILATSFQLTPTDFRPIEGAPVGLMLVYEFSNWRECRSTAIGSLPFLPQDSDGSNLKSGDVLRGADN